MKKGSVPLSLRHFARLVTHTQLLPLLESGEETLVGGQAVMEGVMMRAPHSYCVAVRRSNGEIATEESPLPRVSDKYPIFKLPILRGVGTLGQAMSLGVKALRFSTNVAMEEENAAKGKPEASSEVPAWMMTLNLVFSIGFFIIMYKVLPAFATGQLSNYFPTLQNPALFSLVDGVLRLIIFLSFLYGISRYKDIRRVFEYHGAEHKVVYNFESGKPVTVANAQSFSTLHPRCGTSFLLVVMLISMATYMIVDPLLGLNSIPAKIASRVILIPVIAGLSYELIRFAAKRRGSLLAAMTIPGLWLQKITTQPPSDDQTAIAIHALEGAMQLEQKQGGQLVIA